jgi:hypothetical protein
MQNLIDMMLKTCFGELLCAGVTRRCGASGSRRGRATTAGHLACSAGDAQPCPVVGRPRLAVDRLSPLCANHAHGAGRCATRRAKQRLHLPLRGPVALAQPSIPSTVLSLTPLSPCLATDSGTASMGCHPTLLVPLATIEGPCLGLATLLQEHHAKHPFPTTVRTRSHCCLWMVPPMS